MKRSIYESSRGTSRVSAKNIIPPGARKLAFETQSYEFYIHRGNSRVTLYVQTTDYHPGILSVPIEKLIEFIEYISVS